jgi:unspecific monooxygenase
MQNAPKHTAIRRLFSRAFTKSAVESYRPLVAATIERLLDGLVPLREMNFLTDFAFQLPTAVISELMALPEQVRVGLDALLVDLDLAFVFRSDEEYLDRGDQAVAELLSRMDAVLAERRANPGDDLISRLVGGEDDGVEHEDLVANAVFLLQAGHDTTMNTLTSGVYTLLQNPEQLEALRADPSLVPTAVEEMLRFNSAIGIAPRLANEDVELPNGTVHAGSVVSFFLGAVNRDAETFDDPHRFDVSRVDNPHLAFAAGAHMCVGAPLARLELQMALAAVLDRLPNLRLVDEPRWTGVVPFRGLDKLNVAWG